MITLDEAKEILANEYHIDNFLYVVNDVLLPDFISDRHEVEFKNNIFESVNQLGYSDKCEVTVFEVILKTGSHNRRVTITQEMFKILRGLGINNAIVAFANADKLNYRFSLLTSKYEFDGEKVVKVLSNPRRYSYSLGYGTKTKTAYDFLIGKGKVNSLDELINRFSVEVVNKQFYSEIAACFTRLVGGQRDGKTFNRELNIYGVTDQNKYAEFAVRLIGRIVFCWFLKEKKSEKGVSLIPETLLNTKDIKIAGNYYHDVLEPLFFELLNTSIPRRKGKFAQEQFYSQIPYLNGGLFSPHVDDHYKFSPELQSGQYGVVTIPNDWFDRFYAVLGQYNFTVDENTSYDIELSIDPEMLGRIFENLLAEINPETGENAKKSTGSFYTPRDIVDYMVDSSIHEHLKTKTGISEEKLKALISYGKEDDELISFSETEKKAIVNALYSVTVLDPACGSGAFPIGVLQKIVYMLQEIDPDATLWFNKATENVSFLIRKEFEKKFNAGSLDYIRKLTVIQNSIFGIDIQPIAVEIARLRCFLSLVIEEKVYDDEPNRGINPLPNLDFKFIAANSLISLPEDSDHIKDVAKNQLSIFEKVEHIEQLKSVREEYFSANDAETKNELKFAFSEIQNAMRQAALDNWGNKMASARYEALFQWKPFNNTVTNWFDPNWMFGIKDGFDIVIANPPYIQLQDKSIRAMAEVYSKQGYITFAKTGDIYCLFYEAGYNNLKEGGILTYITSNKWMRAGYGEKLRGFLASKTNPVLLIDFAGQKVFESATVDVNILLFKKENNAGQTQACLIKDKCRNNLSNYIQQNGTVDKFISNSSWIIMNAIENSIRMKIQTKGIPLEKWDIQINYGIKTGFNEAFIISGKIKDELIAQDPKSAEVIRPILRGRDIKKYEYTFSDLWLINVHNGVKIKGIPPIDVDDYPAIKRHLDKFFPILSNRADKGDTPYNLRNCVYMDDFSKQKIVYREISEEMDACIINEEVYVNNKCYIITGEHLEYLICVLNSKLFNRIILQSANQTGGKGRDFLEKIHVPYRDNDILADLYRDLLTTPLPERFDLLKKIDAAVNKLYNLTNEEIDYIDTL